MFLSDELLELGLKANKHNNLSQLKQCDKMLDILIAAQKDGEDQKKLINITRLVIKQLNRAGFSFYSFDIFYGTK